MADVIQAAKWIKEGLHVRRSSFLNNPDTSRYSINPLVGLCMDRHGVLIAANGCTAFILADSLLADDWEVVPVQADCEG